MLPINSTTTQHSVSAPNPLPNDPQAHLSKKVASTVDSRVPFSNHQQEPAQNHQDAFDFDWGSDAPSSSSSTTLPPLSPDSKKIVQNLVQTFSAPPAILTPELALELFENIKEEQDILERYRTDVTEMREVNFNIKIEPTDSFPFSIYVERNAFHVQNHLRKRGEGAYKEVFESQTFITSHFEEGGIPHTPSRIEARALLIAKQVEYTFSPQKRQLEKASDPEVPLARLLSTSRPFIQEDSDAIATSRLYDSTLRSCDYSSRVKPVSDLICNVWNVMRSVASLHRHGHIHRDIKGENILVNRGTHGPDEVVLSDFDSLFEEPRENHITFETPNYKAPFIYGSDPDNLINQRRRVGKQTKNSDLFAIGRMIEIDLLPLFFEQMGVRYRMQPPFSETIKAYNKGRLTSYSGPFSEEDLRSYWIQYQDRSYYVEEDPSQGVAERVIVMDTYPSRTQKLREIANHLKDHLPENEYAALMTLIETSIDIQSNAQNLTLNTAIENLESFVKTEMSSSSSSSSSSQIVNIANSQSAREPRRKVRKLVL